MSRRLQRAPTSLIRVMRRSNSPMPVSSICYGTKCRRRCKPGSSSGSLMSASGPPHLLPPANSPAAAYVVPFTELFKHKKGDDYLTMFFETVEHLNNFPRTILEIVAQLKSLA